MSQVCLHRGTKRVDALRAGEIRIFNRFESKASQKFDCLGLFVSGTLLLYAKASQTQYHCRLNLHFHFIYVVNFRR